MGGTMQIEEKVPEPHQDNRTHKQYHDNKSNDPLKKKFKSTTNKYTLDKFTYLETELAEKIKESRNIRVKDNYVSRLAYFVLCLWRKPHTHARARAHPVGLL
jgi:hypothetical protein